MRLVLIGDGNSIHIKKWVAWYLKNGFKLLLITTSEIKGSFPDLSIVRKLPDPEKKNFPGHWTLIRFVNKIRAAKMVKEFGPEIVHVHRLNDYINHFIHGHPLVMNAWGSEVFQLTKGSLGEKMLRRNIKRADLILSTTKEMMEVLRTRYQVPSERLSNFSWGIDLSLFSWCENKTKKKQECGFNSEKTLFISPRGISPIYRNDVIMDAFSRVHEKNNNVHLVVLGNNLQKETYESLKKQISKRSLEDAVTIIENRLELGEIVPLLQASDFYIGVPLSDQLSSSLLEAMACGCIPIVNDLSAYKNTIRHHTNGFVWSGKRTEDLADIISKAAEPGLDRERWRRSNRELIEREHDWEKQAATLFPLYRRLLK